MKNLIDFIKALVQRYFIDSFYLTFPQIMAILIGLITFPIILANLPIEDYGLFQFVLALEFWLVVLSGNNITLGAKRGIAKGLNGTFLFAFFYRLKLLIIIGLVGFIASFFIYNAGFTTMSLLLTIICVFLILGYLFQISFPEFFIAKKQFRSFAIWQIAISILTITGATVAAFLTHNILIFAITQLGLATFISWLGWLYVVKKNNLVLAYKKGEIDKECIPYGKKLIPADLISLTAAKISHFIIGPFFGFANLAVFSIANKLRDHFAGFMKQARPLLYTDFARNKRGRLIETLNSKLKYGIIISVIITLFCLVAGYLYIKLFLPQAYQTAIIYFFILSLALPMVILQIIMHVILEVNFRYKELSALAIIPNLIKIVLILGLGLAFKIIGVCWGIVLGAWISFGFYYFFTLKREVAIKFIHQYPWLEKLAKKY